MHRGKVIALLGRQAKESLGIDHEESKTSILISRTTIRRRGHCISLAEGENQAICTLASLGVCMGLVPEHLGVLISCMKWRGLGI